MTIPGLRTRARAAMLPREWIGHVFAMGRGNAAGERLAFRNGQGCQTSRAPNELEAFFDQRKSGRGIWKWRHYFEAYDRHFARFRGREVHLLEIGIYSGGSLEMWRAYFGPQARIYGVDIEPACRAYEAEGTRVFIGDQSDRAFWADFRAQVPHIDIVIDDGSHLPEHQIVTLEELLPHVAPNGVYVCEDVHHRHHPFAAYVSGMADALNAFDEVRQDADDPDHRCVVRTNTVQRAIGSIHLYPFLAVIERTASPVAELVAPKHGTEWEPFLK